MHPDSTSKLSICDRVSDFSIRAINKIRRAFSRNKETDESVNAADWKTRGVPNEGGATQTPDDKNPPKTSSARNPNIQQSSSASISSSKNSTNTNSRGGGGGILSFLKAKDKKDKK